MPVTINGTTGVTFPAGGVGNPAGAVVGTTDTQTLTNKSIAATQLTGNIAAARITDALNATGSAPIYACRAWVNFNGTGTVSINASGNVSSVTDNGTGDYTVNFTTAMPDANFAVGGNCLEDTADFRGDRVLTMYRRTPVASSCRVNTVNFAGTVVDNARVYVVIFR
jgi:hypothetical protein